MDQVNFNVSQLFLFWKQFNKQQNIESDFDREVKKLLARKSTRQ